ncbi:MAG: competence protein ComEA [Gammaproteobacteria bacterium]|nr:MAG: competence protein ComEA [Gammaproteobacteria bacterium]
MAASTTATYDKAAKKCEVKYKGNATAIKNCKKKISKPKKKTSTKNKPVDRATTAYKKGLKNCQTKYKSDKNALKKCTAKLKKPGRAKQKAASQKASSTKERSSSSSSSSSSKKDKTTKSATRKTLKPVKINQANWQELAQSLPRIGEQKAKAIISYRNKNGKFKKTDDLLQIPGIGPKTLNEMKPYLKF